MKNINIKDIELLKNKNEEINKLQKIIDESEEAKKIKNIKDEIYELNKKIEKYSKYNTVQIGNIIAKLMTSFEGIKYSCVKNDVFFLDCDYSIEAVSNDRNFDTIYYNVRIKSLMKKKSIFDKEDLTKICLMPPTGFNQNENLPLYVQMFIDYLYERRTSKSLERITEKEIEKIEKEFLEITQELQEQRKSEIEKAKQEKIEEEKKEKFQKSCLIDRKLIYNSLSHVINNYEEGMTCKKEKEICGFSAYHKLIIEKGEKREVYEELIDHDDSYPDEFYEGNLNMNKDTDICFFNLKRRISYLIEDSVYPKKFMNMVEELYKEKKNITVDDIHQILVIISNEKQSKKYKLVKKQKVIY